MKKRLAIIFIVLFLISLFTITVSAGDTYILGEVLTRGSGTKTADMKMGYYFKTSVNPLQDIKTITDILWVDTPFDDTESNVAVVSADGSEYPVYARVVDSKLELYSEADVVYFPKNSNDFFGEAVSNYNSWRFEAVETIDLSKFDLSKTITARWMFAGLPKLKSLDFHDSNTNFGHWDDDVTAETQGNSPIRQMFGLCTNLESIKGISHWDLGEAVDIRRTFDSCESLTELDISNWNVPNLGDLYYAFYDCKSLSSIDISGWNCPYIYELYEAFAECSSLETINMTGISVHGYTGGDSAIPPFLNLNYCFHNCESLKDVSFISDWEVGSGGVSVDSMFYHTAVEEVNIKNWSAPSYSSIFEGATNLKRVTMPDTEFEQGYIPYITGSEGWYYDDASPFYVADDTTIRCSWADGAEHRFSNGHTYIRAESVGAYLGRGWKFNQALKQLVNSSATADTADTTIKHIVWSDTEFTSDCRVDWWGMGEGEPQSAAIYARLNGDTIELYTYADRVVLNSETSSGMFKNFKALESVDLSKYDSSTAKNLGETFLKCSALKSIDLSQGYWNTSNVISMQDMFNGCSSLETLNLGDNFDTSNVTAMGWMFYQCGLTNLDLKDKFNTEKVTEFRAMFAESPNLTTLNLGDNFDTSSATNMRWMFNACNALTSLDLGDKFNTSNVEDMAFMFARTWHLNNIDFGNSNFTAQSSTTLEKMFYEMGYYCDTRADLLLPDTFNAQNATSLNGMFYDAKFNSLDLGANFNAASATDITNIFKGAEAVTVNLGDNFNLRSATDLSQMFAPRVAFSNATSIDLGANFGGQSATTMLDMFSGYISDTKSTNSTLTSLNLGEGFHTENCTSMSGMFYGQTGITSIDLGNYFDTSKVTTMRSMFGDDSGLSSIVLGSNFDTSLVTDMHYMFGSCPFTSIDFGDKFNTSNVTDFSAMFLGCIQITELRLPTTFDTTKGTDFSRMFDIMIRLDILDISPMTINTGANVDGFLVSLVSDGETYVLNSSSSKPSIIYSPKYVGDVAINLMYNESPTGIHANTYYYLDDNNNTYPDTNIKYKFLKSNENTSRKYIYKTELNPVATFSRGEGVNIIIKTLIPSISGNITRFTVDNTIKDIRIIHKESPNNSAMIGKSDNNDKYTATYIDIILNGDTLEIYSLADDLVLNEDSKYFLSYLQGLEDVSFIKELDTSKVKEMGGFFEYNVALETVDFSNMSFDACTSFGGLFSNCTNLKTTNFSNINTPNLKELSQTFKNTKVSTLDLSDLDIADDCSLNETFDGCSELVSLTLPKNTTGYITNLYGTFNNCSKLTSVDFSDTIVTVTAFLNVFNNCSALTDVTFGDTFTLKGNGTLQSSFSGCTSLRTLDMHTLEIGSSNYISPDFITGAVNLTKYVAPKTIPENINITLPAASANKAWFIDDVEPYNSPDDTLTYTTVLNNLTDTPHTYIIDDVSKLKAYFITGRQFKWEIDKLFDSSLTLYDFYGNTQVTNMKWVSTPFTSDCIVSIPDKGSPIYARAVQNLLSDTYTIELYTFADVAYINPDAQYMFANFKNATNLDILNSKVLFESDSDVKSLTSMFAYCESLKTLDLSRLDTTNTVSMAYMFNACKSLETLNLGDDFDTSSVTSMRGMFAWCTKITALDLSSFDVSKVTNMSEMFNGCVLLSSLDTSNFVTSNLTNTEAMFAYCKSMPTIDVSHFNMSNVTNDKRMFMEDINTVSIILPINLTHVDTNMFYHTNALSSITGLKNVTSLASGAFFCEPTDTNLRRLLQFPDYDAFVSDCWLDYDWVADNRTTCIYLVSAPALINTIDNDVNIGVSKYISSEEVVTETQKAVKLNNVTTDEEMILYLRSSDIGASYNTMTGMYNLKTLSEDDTNINYINAGKKQDDSNVYYLFENYKFKLLKDEDKLYNVGTYNGNLILNFSIDISA